MARTRPLALFATIGSLTLLDGCSSWQKPRVGEGGKPTLSDNHNVRVLLASGNTIELTKPQLTRDSLIGEMGLPPKRTAVALSEVRRLEERKTSAAKTGALGCGAVGIAAVVGALVLFAALLSDFQ